MSSVSVMATTLWCTIDPWDSVSALPLAQKCTIHTRHSWHLLDARSALPAYHLAVYIPDPTAST